MVIGFMARLHKPRTTPLNVAIPLTEKPGTTEIEKAQSFGMSFVLTPDEHLNGEERKRIVCVLAGKPG